MKAELKSGSVNQIIKGTDIFERGDEVTCIGLVIKGRVRIHAQGVNLVVGSGNFLGLCDLPKDIHSVTYTAETNSAIYAFSANSLIPAVRGLMKANKDYAALMVSTLSKYIRELSVIYEELEEMADSLYHFLKDSCERFPVIAREHGVDTDPVSGMEQINPAMKWDTVDQDKVAYYKACCTLPPEVQKMYFGAVPTITQYHITEQVELVEALIEQCEADAQYLCSLAGPLIKDDYSLYIAVLQMTSTLQNMGADASNGMSLFDDVIDRVNSLETLLLDKAGIDLEIDHEFMEDAYFSLLNHSNVRTGTASMSDEFALVEESLVGTEDLKGTLAYIIEYAELDIEKGNRLNQLISDFQSLSDKFSTDDNVRTLRREIMKIYYDLYEKIFRKDYRSQEDTPLIIDLFLRYGFISENLLSEELQEELLSLEHFRSGNNGVCKVYDMKEWLTEIYEGRKEPSKSEFDLDYEEYLRDQKKTGRITADQQQELAKNRDEKLKYEIHNMFKTNHRLTNGQISTFVPFLYTSGCTGSLSRNYLSREKINAAVRRLQQIDYSVFYRESLFMAEVEGIKKEYVVEEVYPDVILFPGCGSNGIMWQELSGRRRNSRGRFLLPYFFEADLDAVMVKLFGRFRWELCRTMQGAAWNNIQIKSLTSEYSDFIQFYRKNRELSEERKDKLKMQIQKCRNNTREVFVLDYENWIKHEAQGGLCLSKPVREIMATYCPFAREMRENIMEQPLFQAAMARFIRERGKKKKEYDLKFRVWDKDGVQVPQEIIDTRDFYVDK